jgi:hypothetical protein
LGLLKGPNLFFFLAACCCRLQDRANKTPVALSKRSRAEDLLLPVLCYGWSV